MTVDGTQKSVLCYYKNDELYSHLKRFKQIVDPAVTWSHVSQVIYVCITPSIM